VGYALTWALVFIAVYNYGSTNIPADIIMALAYGLADAVASGDMAADMQNPDQSINPDYLENNPITPPTDTNKQPHWYTTPEALSMLAKAKTPFEFGIALHMLQDSFSHWQKLGEPDSALGIWSGHLLNDISVIFGGKSIDNYDPNNNPIDAAMLKAMQDEIDEYVRKLVQIWETHVPI
jgi:hypothetical protein